MAGEPQYAAWRKANGGYMEDFVRAHRTEIDAAIEAFERRRGT